VSYLLSLLALKLTATRRVSHIYNLAADPGAALFAGLVALLPKTIAPTTYAYRLAAQQATGIPGRAGQGHAGRRAGDWRADQPRLPRVMHWGEDVALEKHYVPWRSSAPAAC